MVRRSTGKSAGKKAAKTGGRKTTPKKTAPRRVRRSAPRKPKAEPTARKASAPSRAPTERPSRDRSRPTGVVRELTWARLEGMARNLATEVSRNYDPDLVIGLVKGGVYAGREVAAALKRPFFAVRLHARSRDAGGLEATEGVPDDVAGKRVLVVDDIAGTGATLRAAIAEAREAGAREVHTCTLVMREQGWRPDWFAIETSDLVVLPWDYEPTTGAVGFGEDEGV